MSLATRCTACGTVFRIVQDQLKVSEGWVRCGRCNVVFNALEGLFDLERDGMPPTPPPATPPGPDAGEWVRDEDAPRDIPGAGAPAARHEGDDADRAAAGEAAPVDAARADAAPDAADAAADRVRAHAALDRVRDHSARHDRPAASATAPHADVDARTDDVDAEADGGAPDDDRSVHDTAARTPAVPVAFGATAGRDGAVADPDALWPDGPVAADDAFGEPAESRFASGPTDFDADAAPGFVRHAQRQERWRTPAMRAALGAALLLLVGALAVQAAHHFRDTVAARWPQARPALLAWCERLGCTVEAPRRIDDVAVESSTLARAAAPDAFALSVVLRNRGALPVAVPAVDLSLTDPEGRLIARRVLTPRDFRVASEALAPGAGVPLQLVLSAGTPRVSGYTVEIFYP